MGNPSPSAPPLPLHESLLGQDQQQQRKQQGFDPQQQLDAGYIDPYPAPPPFQYPGLGGEPNPNPNPNPSPAVVFGFPAAAAPPVLQPWRAPPQIPPSLPAQPHHRRQDGATSRWSSGLCSCCADPGVCLVGCCCPCVLFGRVASTLDQADADADADAGDCDGGAYASHDAAATTMMMVDTSSCSAPCIIWYALQQFTGMGWIYSCAYRAKLQARFGIKPHHGANCILHLCCWHCAFCQEYRELKTRRRRELERRQQQQPIMVPPLAQSMMHHG